MDFLIVLQPTFTTNFSRFFNGAGGPSTGRLFLGKSALFNTLPLGANGTMRVICPKRANRATLRGRFVPGQEPKFQVRQNSDLAYFNVADDRELPNVLVLKEPPSHDIVLWDEINGQETKYRRATVSDLGLENASARPLNRFLERIFIQFWPDDQADLAKHSLQVDSASVKELADNDTREFWLNPIIFRVSTSGDDFALPKDSTVTIQTVANHLLGVDAKAVLAIEPILGAEFDARVALLQQFCEDCRSNERVANFSTIERLFLGPKPTSIMDDPWKAFLCLDRLGGTFTIEDHGSGAPRFCWTPVKRLSPNARWLADHYVKCWGGAEPTVAPNSARIPVEPPARSIVSKTESMPESVGGDELQTLSRSCSKMLKKMPSAVQTESLTVYGWIASILNQPVLLQSSVQTLHRGHYQTRREISGQYTIDFDAQGFLQDFSDVVLMPDSPVLIKMPEMLPAPNEREVENRYRLVRDGFVVDLKRSVSNGSREVFFRLFNYRTGINPVNNVCLTFTYGWWNKWFETLFSHSSNVQINFNFERGGFILKSSRLNEAALGKSESAFMQMECVRF
jgi:hypothetical protein